MSLKLHRYHSTDKKAATLGYFNIFINKNLVNKNKIEFDSLLFLEGEVIFDRESLDRIGYQNLKNELSRLGFLKESFRTVNDQNQLVKAMKYVLAYQLIHTNFIGTKATKLIIDQLVDGDQDYFNFFGKGDYSFIPGLLLNINCIQAIGNARNIKAYLKDNLLEETISDFIAYCEPVNDYFVNNPSEHGSTISVRESCQNLINSILNLDNYFKVFKNI